VTGITWACRLCSGGSMADLTRRRLLWIAATDATFELDHARAVIEGKCIHCSRRLRLRLDGTPVSRATIEHIVARTHGGGDDLENLAIACAGCNQGKGHRLDVRRSDDPKLVEVQATLRQRRRRRWREPPADWDLPPRS
jgi:5-methylcytosine-specific restriction endonuclease McrA